MAGTGEAVVRQSPSGFERHLQTALAMVLIMLVGWGANKISESLETLIRFDERLKTIEEKLNSLESANTGLRLREVEIRLGALERKMEVRDD